MYKYYLLYNGIKSEIDREPIGWDSFETTIGRNEKSHGIGIEYSENDLKFYDDISIALLKEAYADDINNIVLFSIEYNGDEQYRGSIDFTNYSECFDNYHYILTRILDVGIESKFFVRQEQKVNLNSLIAFDGSSLPEYSALKKNIILPSVEMLYTSDTKREEDGAYSATVQSSLNGRKMVMYSIPLGDIVMNEISDLNALTEYVSFGESYSEWTDNTFNIGHCVFRYVEQEGMKLTSQEFDLKLYLKGSISITSWVSGDTRVGISIVIIGEDGRIKQTLKNNEVGLIYQFDELFSYKVFLNAGDMIAIVYYAYINRSSFIYDYEIQMSISEGSYFSLTALNKTTGTTANVSMIHEVLSRIVEATTNGQITVKSDYYGRRDSNIHPTASDGEGSIRALATGLHIRNASDPLFTMSFVDIFKGIQPIDNVGYGFVWENGVRLLRIEPYQWFYSDNTVILEVNSPKSKITSLETNNVFSILKIGYKKYETEGTNGLDAFLTEREYRTRQTITSVKMEQVSEFIADGYAIEQTRRQGSSSKDWRYDNDIFIIQLKNPLGEYSVEQGVLLSQGLISRDTVYNARISPARCAKKWLNRLFGWSNKQEELIFTSGTGNINASTSMGPTEIPLIDENGSFPAAPENTVLRSEVTEFEYPITIAQYNAIITNPYGVINLDGYPYYLRKMTFNWKSRIASFEVVAKANLG